jgi:hypothetical protein
VRAGGIDLAGHDEQEHVHAVATAAVDEIELDFVG